MNTNISVASYLNQIFYPHNKFDDCLNELEPWMLTADKIKTVVSESEEKRSFVPLIPVVQSKKQIFAPTKTDTLFWCAYIIGKGEAEYNMIGNRYKNAEIEEKHKMIDFMKKNPDSIKSSFKIAAVKMKEIMSELMMDKKTSWSAFLVMCVYYKCSAIVCYKKTYLEFCVKDAEHIYLFHRDDLGHISVDTTELDENEIKDICNSKIHLGNSPEKPLKAASHYKMEDLLAMAEKLGIACGQNKWKKSDWYEEILKELSW